MSNFECNKCNKVFTRKHNYLYHINNINRPCSTDFMVVPPISSGFPPISSGFPPISSGFPPISSGFPPVSSDNLKSNIEDKESINSDKTLNDLLIQKINELMNPKFNNLNTNICVYCDIVFTRTDNLQRHLKERCKSKKNYDELEKLKEKLDIIMKENERLKNKEVNHNINNTTNNTTNNTKNQINNGIINNNNNNVNVQLVQFGSENIDNIDSNEAIDVYYNSTGGNILSNVLKLVNLNENYPENHNICISDLSRKHVKVFNGKKFIIKKFDNVKDDIMCKVIKNTYKLVDKIESDESIVLNNNIISRFKVNNVSVKLIDGHEAKDIIREEIRKKENSINENDSIDSKKEREFNLEERLKIKKLQEKQQGLIDISLERLKDELYNGKDLIEKSRIMCKSNNKHKYLKTK